MALDSKLKPLNDLDFLALSREDAAEHLAEVRRNNLWVDSDRLHGIWWDEHKESLNSYVSEATPPAAPGVRAREVESGMLNAGRVLCLVGVTVSFLAGILGVLELQSGGISGIPLLGISYLSGSLATLGVIFWVAGALEQRLLEIKQAIALRMPSS